MFMHMLVARYQHEHGLDCAMFMPTSAPVIQLSLVAWCRSDAVYLYDNHIIIMLHAIIIILHAGCNVECVCLHELMQMP